MISSAAFDAGIFTFDCADIYTGVEDLYGEARARIFATRGAEAAKRMRVHTKLVPDLDLLPRINRRDVEAIVDRSLQRLKVDTLDLVQFHWWDYAQPRWLEALRVLDDLRQAGKLRHVGGTNFDSRHVQRILEANIPLISMQVQFSLLDPRPESGLAALARANGVGLLCYGTVAGGFLSDRWLGAREPTGALENRSLVKYKLIIDDFGGWPLFQELLRACAASPTGTASISPGGEPRGARSTGRRRRDRRRDLAGASRSQCRRPSVSADREPTAPRSRPLPPGAKVRWGKFTQLERDRARPHGSIMKYNLNAERV